MPYPVSHTGVRILPIIQILTAHEGNGKLLSRGKIQPLPTIDRGP